MRLINSRNACYQIPLEADIMSSRLCQIFIRSSGTFAIRAESIETWKRAQKACEGWTANTLESNSQELLVRHFWERFVRRLRKGPHRSASGGSSIAARVWGSVLLPIPWRLLGARVVCRRWCLIGSRVWLAGWRGAVLLGWLLGLWHRLRPLRALWPSVEGGGRLGCLHRDSSAQTLVNHPSPHKAM